MSESKPNSMPEERFHRSAVLLRIVDGDTLDVGIPRVGEDECEEHSDCGDDDIPPNPFEIMN